MAGSAKIPIVFFVLASCFTSYAIGSHDDSQLPSDIRVSNEKDAVPKLVSSLKFKPTERSDKPAGKKERNMALNMNDELKKMKRMRISLKQRTVRRGLRVRVKRFASVSMINNIETESASYKIYVLQGNNIRHYRVRFRARAFADVPPNEREVIQNCIRRKYLRRCIRKPGKQKQRCTSRIVKECVDESGEVILFEDASPLTSGQLRSSPLPSPSNSPIPAPPESPNNIYSRVG